ncbi:uncharacterized protein C8orf58 homolog [Ctenodactylus gundi]
MLGRRRVFAVESLAGRQAGGEDLAQGCVVPGVTSTYRRIPDVAPECVLGSGKGEGALEDLENQVPLVKLASRDSGVEMVARDSSLATFPELSQDSVDLETMGTPEPAALAAVESPGQLGRLLASRKLEQVLERSRRRPGSSGQRCALQLGSKPGYAVPFFGAGNQESTEADAKLQAGLEAAEVVEGAGPESWACLPGQGLRYLEHLCLVLEQMARFQQLYLQLWTQRPPGPQPSIDGVSGSEELQSQTGETGTETALPPKFGVLSANLPRLPEAPADPTRSFPPSQEHKQDLTHWDKLKVLLNRIRWRSPGRPEPSAPPDRSGTRIESRDLSESPQCHSHRKTFMPSLVVKKQ